MNGALRTTMRLTNERNPRITKYTKLQHNKNVQWYCLSMTGCKENKSIEIKLRVCLYITWTN